MSCPLRRLQKSPVFIKSSLYASSVALCNYPIRKYKKSKKMNTITWLATTHAIVPISITCRKLLKLPRKYMFLSLLAYSFKI